ncbi:hypothetical protein FOZ62_030872 [Perkinsus olseni]|uniref:Uncharacterized protein n=1 Tax=Perkinsus olseni TaxID=32597 RepID=A0A7J6RFI6_PEROL|nr:hypothetical protein FOZ62_030872 [Perkinsus olseni]
MVVSTRGRRLLTTLEVEQYKELLKKEEDSRRGRKQTAAAAAVGEEEEEGISRSPSYFTILGEHIMKPRDVEVRAIKYTYDRVRDNTVYNERVKNDTLLPRSRVLDTRRKILTSQDIGWYTSGEVLSIMDNHNKQVSNEKKSMMMRYTQLSRMGYW